MTLRAARIWLIKWSIAITGALFLFFAAAPAIRYPLKYEDAFDILKIIVPLFVGYLSSGARYVVGQPNDEGDQLAPNHELLTVLLKWPIWIFCACSIVLLSAFGYSNSGRFTGDGMTPKTLSLFVSALLSVLAATTSMISVQLFREKSKSVKAKPAAG